MVVPIYSEEVFHEEQTCTTFSKNQSYWEIANAYQGGKPLAKMQQSAEPEADVLLKKSFYRATKNSNFHLPLK
jgi:hypothetical protein